MQSQLPFAPMQEAGPEDADSEFIAFLDTPRAKVNVAANADVRNTLDQIWDTIRQVKSRRQTLEEEWLAIQRMIVLAHDDGRKYIGRSAAYLPVYARARKTLTSQITKNLFPSDEYMDVSDRENGQTEAAKSVKTVIQYEFDVSARARAMFKPFVGQFVDFGFAVMKRWYRTNKVIKPKRVRTKVAPTKMGDVKYDEGFTLSNRSVFNVVVYPEWAEEKRDLQIEAERMEVSSAYVNAMANSKRWVNCEEALTTGANSDNFDWCNQQSMVDVSSIPGTYQWRNAKGHPMDSVTIVEAWFRMVFPKDQYADDEDPTLPVPARAVFVNGVPVLCRRNPFYDQESPYEYARDNIVAGNFYGNGAGRLVRFLQYLANDFANQTNDVGIYGLNPITLVNTSYFSGAMDALKPGRTYRVRDLDKSIKFVSPDVNIVQWGQGLLNSIVLMAQDGSGAMPVLQGSKAASTATGTERLQQNAMQPLQDTVEDIEAQVMIPLMRAAWELARQFRNKPFFRKVLGEPPVDANGQPLLDPITKQPMPAPMVVHEILPANIDIDCEMKYLASSQAVSRSARQQQLLAFIQLMQPLMPLLQLQGKMLNPELIAQRGWSDGLGNRNFDKLIIPMPMQGMPMQGGGPVQPGQPQPPPAEQGNVIPPGEAEQADDGSFNEVRDNVNMMNGQGY